MVWQNMVPKTAKAQHIQHVVPGRLGIGSFMCYFKVLFQFSNPLGAKLKHFFQIKHLPFKMFYFLQNCFIPFRNVLFHSKCFPFQIRPDPNKSICTILLLQTVFISLILGSSFRPRAGQEKQNFISKRSVVICFRKEKGLVR